MRRDCHFRTEMPKLRNEIDGAAYRIRTYDPRITKVILATRKCEETEGFRAYPAGQTLFTKWAPKLARVPGLAFAY